jgi:hypothetical protein
MVGGFPVILRRWLRRPTRNLLLQVREKKMLLSRAGSTT